MDYTVLNKNTGEVINIIIWDGITDLGMDESLEVVPCTPEHRTEWINKHSNNQASDSQKELELLQLLLDKYRDQIS